MQMLSHNKKLNGFTLLELLVIFACAGLACSIIFYFLNSLRIENSDIQKLHDTRRLQDITQIRTGLELFQTLATGYPDASLWGKSNVIGCNDQRFLATVGDPGSVSGSYVYKTYGNPSFSSVCNAKVWPEYSFQFVTEGETTLGLPGTYCLTSHRGIVVGDCK